LLLRERAQILDGAGARILHHVDIAVTGFVVLRDLTLQFIGNRDRAAKVVLAVQKDLGDGLVMGWV
jgi:hypothetical protein